jgi:hypothetical protein
MNLNLFRETDKAVLNMIRRASDEHHEGTLAALKEARESLLKTFLLVPELV